MSLFAPPGMEGVWLLTWLRTCVRSSGGASSRSSDVIWAMAAGPVLALLLLLPAGGGGVPGGPGSDGTGGGGAGRRDGAGIWGRGVGFFGGELLLRGRRDRREGGA